MAWGWMVAKKVIEHISDSTHMSSLPSLENEKYTVFISPQSPQQQIHQQHEKARAKKKTSLAS
jgi:hypothetical protein